MSCWCCYGHFVLLAVKLLTYYLVKLCSYGLDHRIVRAVSDSWLGIVTLHLHESLSVISQ